MSEENRVPMTDLELISDLQQELSKKSRELEEVKSKLNWQNWPNKRSATRDGYEFYINEEWVALRDAAIGEDVGFIANLMKTRYDPDDERVRVRKVIFDDILLNELAQYKIVSENLAEALELCLDALRFHPVSYDKFIEYDKTSLYGKSQNALHKFNELKENE